MKIILINLFIFPFIYFAQETKINSQKIAADNFNSIVKIILMDSVAEKKVAGSGYYGRGSGFIVSEEGLIFTNKHVVQSALGMTNITNYDGDEGNFITTKEYYSPKQLNEDVYSINYVTKMSIIIQVYDRPELNSYKLYVAKIVSIDTSNFDGAILQITKKLDGTPISETFNPVTLGDSDSTYQGEDLCILGFPMQYKGNFETMINDQSTLSIGKHAGFDFFISKDIGYIKTDVAINGGNSGGPVFNNKGEVIGLASAASQTTGNGFIAKINGMYNLTVNDFSLYKKLKQKGLTNPNLQINVNGILNNPNYLIPSNDRLSKFNLDKKNERLFLGGFWYLKGQIALMNNNSYKVNPSLDSTITVNSEEKLNVKHKSYYQAELGKVFSFNPFNSSNKLGVDWTLMNVGFYKSDWTNAGIMTDTSKSRIVFNPDQTQIVLTAKLGLVYTQLLFNRNLLNIYYKIGYSVNVSKNSREFKDEIGHFENTTNSIRYENTSLNNTFGIDYHFNKLILGFEYNFGKSNGNSTFQSRFNNDLSLTGQTFVSNFNFCIGFPIYNNKKWKKYY